MNGKVHLATKLGQSELEKADLIDEVAALRARNAELEKRLAAKEDDPPEAPPGAA